MNAAQEATQHLASIFKLLLDRRFDKIHGGRPQLCPMFGGIGSELWTDGFSLSAMVEGGEEEHGPSRSL